MYFNEYMLGTSSEDLAFKGDHECLADYIRSWVMSGYGVRACNGDFQQFTLAVVAIIDEWTRDPGILDHVRYLSEDPQNDDAEVIERRVTTIFGNPYTYTILDPTTFAEATFRELYGNRDCSPLSR
ncbi:hypothetical protein [Amycolatopsis samaneae]|uniref:Uncharacterized protein n=1 Tax=Amycolatopsis samaneae TaxID=664691 RepID=A0ABW5GI98_9PSEU